jgi:PAS domain-containing protein
MPESEYPFDAPEMWIRAGFDALAAHIAVLDGQGTIVAVNAAWERFGRAHQAPSFVWAGVGLNYLEECRRAAVGSVEAQDALTGLRSALVLQL